SASGCALAYAATSVIQGVGIMMLADEMAPLSSASKLAALAEWAKPRSSACRISSFESRGYPSRSATVLVWAASEDAMKSSVAESQRSVGIGNLEVGLLR